MCSRSLQTLNLGHNRLTNEGICTLKEGLLRNHSLQRLGLLNTRLTSEGMLKGDKGSPGLDEGLTLVNCDQLIYGISL